MSWEELVLSLCGAKRQAGAEGPEALEALSCDRAQGRLSAWPIMWSHKTSEVVLQKHVLCSPVRAHTQGIFPTVHSAS